MITVLSWLIIGLSLLIAGYAAYRTARGRGLDDPLLFGVAGLEVLLIAQLIIGLISLAGSDRDIDGVTFVGYLIGVVVLPPVGAVWALFERTRWGPAVIIVVGISVAVMVVRLQQLWTAPLG